MPKWCHRRSSIARRRRARRSRLLLKCQRHIEQGSIRPASRAADNDDDIDLTIQGHHARRYPKTTERGVVTGQEVTGEVMEQVVVSKSAVDQLPNGGRHGCQVMVTRSPLRPSPAVSRLPPFPLPPLPPPPLPPLPTRTLPSPLSLLPPPLPPPLPIDARLQCARLLRLFEPKVKSLRRSAIV